MHISLFTTLLLSISAFIANIYSTFVFLFFRPTFLELIQVRSGPTGESLLGLLQRVLDCAVRFSF